MPKIVTTIVKKIALSWLKTSDALAIRAASPIRSLRTASQMAATLIAGNTMSCSKVTNASGDASGLLFIWAGLAGRRTVFGAFGQIPTISLPIPCF